MSSKMEERRNAARESERAYYDRNRALIAERRWMARMRGKVQEDHPRESADRVEEILLSMIDDGLKKRTRIVKKEEKMV